MKTFRMYLFLIPFLVLFCLSAPAYAETIVDGVDQGGGSGSGDMTKAVYDIGDNSKVDDTDAVTAADEAADTTCFPLFVTAATGSLAPKTNAGLFFNSATGMLGATYIGATGTRVTKGWFTDAEITNLPTINGGTLKAALSVDDLVTLSGVADGAANLGEFTGSTITDNQTLKAALQLVETALELKALNLLTGFSAGAGTVADTDTVLQAFNKVVGNIALKANIDNPTFTTLVTSPAFKMGTGAGAGYILVSDADGNFTWSATLSISGLTSGGIVLGDSTPGVAGGYGYDSGKFSFYGANSEDLYIEPGNAANSAVIGSSTGVTDLSFGAINLASTGTIQAGIKISSDADGMSAAEMTAVGLYGTLFLATGAGTWILPTAAVGMSMCLMDDGAAHDLILDVQADDDMSLKGTEDTNGDGITNATGSTTGDFVCVVCTSAGHWKTMGMQGTWTAQ